MIVTSINLTIKERDFQAMVLQVATLKGWLTHHEYDSRRSTPGYPDLTLVRAPRLIFAELKTEKGRVRPDQVIWMNGLRACGIECYLWRPRDWDALVQILSSPERILLPDDHYSSPPRRKQPNR